MKNYNFFVERLKSNPQLASLVTKLLDSWSFLQSNDQAIFVEAVEQLIVNADTSTTTLGVLQEAIEKLRCQTESNKSHALILVENKFLALYSRYVHIYITYKYF